MSSDADKQKRIAEEVAGLHRIGINAVVKVDSHAYTLHLETGKPLLKCQQALAKAKGDLHSARLILHGTYPHDFDGRASQGCGWPVIVSAVVVLLLMGLLLWIAIPLILFVLQVAVVFGILFLVFDVYPWVGIGILFGIFSARRK